MVSHTYEQLVYLKSFIGEKKLKQIGLLHCNTCPLPSQVTFPPFVVEDEEGETEVQSFDELLDHLFRRYSPTTLVYQGKSATTLDISSKATFCCPECGKNYAITEADTYEALPLALSDVEVDALKGIFVDHFL
jgi:transcription elongation factor Elf1